MKLAVAQFQPTDGEKQINLQTMEHLIQRAQSAGADVISFHEMCITAYTHTRDLSKDQIQSLAETVPTGPSCKKLIELARKYNMAILAGLLEQADDKFYNTYVCATASGIIARYRKLHPFISKHLSPGNEYCVFDLQGWKCGILICYDNNVIENVRATTLMGAELVFAPHVTCCTPSSMPGRGYVEDRFWQQRNLNPEALRREFDGPKGRGWLMRWLPARAYDNGVYYAFTNPIGYDGEHLKNGNSMILDPYGDVLVEARSFEPEFVVADIGKDKLKKSGGYRYRKARRPELYKDILGADHTSDTAPIWLDS